MVGRIVDATTIIQTRPEFSDRFDVLSVLGQGTSALVYKVRDRQKNNEEVALKVLLNDTAFDELTLQRFIEELRVSQKIHHQNIVQAYDLITLEDTIAFTMEYVNGRELGAILKEPNLSSSRIDNIFIQVLEGLKVLHANDIVHRDLKLENVLITDQDIVKISDLGLLKRLDSKGLTKTGILLGTAHYMPPEYIHDSKFDVRSDIYSVGLMLLEVVTGKRYLANKNGNEVIEYLIKNRFRLDRNLLKGLEPKYQYIVKKATEPNPKLRFQTVEEMLDALRTGHVPREFNIETDGVKLNANIKFNNIDYVPQKRSFFNSLSFGKLFIAVSLIAFITILLALFVRIVSNSGTTQLVLTSGTYQGSLNILNGESKSIILIVTEAKVLFSSSLSECSNGYVNVSSGEIDCETSGYKLNISKSTESEISGALVTRTGASIPFKVIDGGRR